MSDERITPEEAVEDLAYLCREVEVGRMSAELAVRRARRVLALAPVPAPESAPETER